MTWRRTAGSAFFVRCITSAPARGGYPGFCVAGAARARASVLFPRFGSFDEEAFVRVALLRYDDRLKRGRRSRGLRRGVHLGHRRVRPEQIVTSLGPKSCKFGV